MNKVMVCYKAGDDATRTVTFPNDKLAKVFQAFLNETYGSRAQTKFIYLGDDNG